MIRTPPGWGADMIAQAYHSVIRSRPAWTERLTAVPDVRRVYPEDLVWALRRGWEDFVASRSDVVLICLIYPVAGLLLARLAFGQGLLHMLFPLASGFALIGPLAAVGLNEMSRRRELGITGGWPDALGVFQSPSLGGILTLGGILLAMLLLWLVMAETVYEVTLGPKPPVSMAAFAHGVLATTPGWIMAVVGIGIGAVFAVVAFLISVVSFPMMLDYNVSLEVAVRTSLRVVRRSPRTMTLWGLIIVAGLIVGSIPALLGLIVVMPVLGHATWHLYRRAVLGPD